RVSLAAAHLFQAPKVIRSPEAVVVYQTLAAAQLFQPQRILAASKQRQLASASPPLSFLRLAMEASAIKDNDGVRRPAMIYPGDTIEYFSPVFIAGDMRALRTAVVIEVDPEHDLYPIRINAFEILPLFTVVKPTLSRTREVLEEKWRQLRAYELVPGRFDVPSRESELTVELRRAVEAIKMPETPLQETNEMDVSLAGSHEDNLASSTRLPTLADRNKRHHRGKDRLGVRKVSRKRGHQKQRKPSRCSHA
ncbi:hypothetical protein PF005_g28095, partial [Phytophthora fragariae]